jgi:hypothetical protein
MMKNNLGWIVALILVAGQPVLSAVPQLCLWDMYALAAVAGSSPCCMSIFTEKRDLDRLCNNASYVANEMIKRRSK